MARPGSEAGMRIASRRTKVAALLAREITNQYDICRHLGMDPISGQPTISNDVKWCRKQWQASAVFNFDEAKGRELAKLDLLEKTYWEAWEESKVEKQTTKTRRVDSNSPSTMAEATKTKRDGDPRLLDGVMKCITKRCQILGLDAPVEHNVAAFAVSMTDEQRAAGVAALLTRVGYQVNGSHPDGPADLPRLTVEQPGTDNGTGGDPPGPVAGGSAPLFG